MSIRTLVAVVGVAGAVALPTTFANAAETLPEGTYLVALNDEVSVMVDVESSGATEVDAPLGVQVHLEFDGDGRPLDEFDVVLANGDVFGVDIDADDDGSYSYRLDAPEAADAPPSAVVEPTADAGSEEAEPSAGESEEMSEAPGQHGRDNAREHGGNANGFGAEGTAKDKEAKDAAQDERQAERDAAKADRKSKD